MKTISLILIFCLVPTTCPAGEELKVPASVEQCTQTPKESCIPALKEKINRNESAVSQLQETLTPQKTNDPYLDDVLAETHGMIWGSIKSTFKILRDKLLSH